MVVIGLCAGGATQAAISRDVTSSKIMSQESPHPYFNVPHSHLDGRTHSLRDVLIAIRSLVSLDTRQPSSCLFEWGFIHAENLQSNVDIFTLVKARLSFPF